MLLGNGNGTFRPVTYFSTAVGISSMGIVAADVNGDSKLDLLTANSGSYSGAGVLLGNGDGTFGNMVNYGTGASSGPHALAVADVNGDGRLDVLTANYGNNTVGMLLGNGNGTFGGLASYSTGANSRPQGIAVADVNGDGKPDVLTANGGTDAVGLLLGTGTGTFQAVATFSTGTGSTPQSVAVADVNGDGKPDVVTTNFNDNTVGVLLGTGSGSFGAAASYSTGTGSGPAGLAVADVNADGKPDLMVANYFGNTAGVFLNTTAFLPTRAALPGTAATLAPNPARTSAALAATGLPAAATQLSAILTDALGRPVRRLTVPATAGAATGSVPTTGLAAGLYLLQLEALDAQGAALGALPTQRLSVE